MSLGPPPADPARLVTRGFVALAVATLAFFIAAGIVLPVAPTFAKEALGADETGVGIAIASFSIASLILRPLVGWSSDRFGRRPLLIGGALVTVAALGLHLVATDLPIFIAARALLGAGEGFFFVASIAAGADLAPEDRRGEALSFPLAIAVPGHRHRAAHRRGPADRRSRLLRRGVAGRGGCRRGGRGAVAARARVGAGRTGARGGH